MVKLLHELPRGTASAVIALLLLLTLTGEVHAEGEVRPMPQPPQNGARETAPPPKPELPEANRERPPEADRGEERGGGCPYRKRKLELIV